MKRVKFLEEIRSLTTQQLLDRIKELQVSLYNFRVNKKFGKMSQNHLFNSVRNDIARIKFVLLEKKRGEHE